MVVVVTVAVVVIGVDAVVSVYRLEHRAADLPQASQRESRGGVTLVRWASIGGLGMGVTVSAW